MVTMGTTTKIQWCDSTASPWTVCTPESEGCRNCYARGEAKRRGWSAEWGAGVPRHRFSTFDGRVMAMERKAAKGKFHVCHRCGHREWLDRDKFRHESLCICGALAGVGRPRVFPSLCDWLDPEATNEMLVDYIDVVRRSPNLDHMMLSKRVGLWMTRLLEARLNLVCGDMTTSRRLLWDWITAWLDGNPPANVWIGATVEGPEQLWRVADLLRVPAVRRFVSVEPMLGPVDLAYTAFNGADSFGTMPGIDAVFCGGETGRGARPMHPDWARLLRDQCVAAGVAFTFKAWGEWGRCGEDGLTLDNVPYMSGRSGFWRDGAFIEGLTTDRDCEHMVRVGTKRAGRLLDGRTWDGKDGGR